jgi:hypothetical protein
MQARDAGKPKLAGRIEVDDAYLGGQRPGGKRGRGAAGKTPGLFGSAYEWFVRVGLAAKGPAGRLSC